MNIKNLMGILTRLPDDAVVEAVFKTGYGHSEKANLVAVDVKFLNNDSARIALKLEEAAEEGSAFESATEAA